MTTGSDEHEPSFIRPRILVGILLYVLVAALALIDAVSPDYNLDSIQLALMLGTGGVILGVEPLRRLLK
jgi:hypothetical protein